MEPSQSRLALAAAVIGCACTSADTPSIPAVPPSDAASYCEAFHDALAEARTRCWAGALQHHRGQLARRRTVCSFTNARAISAGRRVYDSSRALECLGHIRSVACEKLLPGEPLIDPGGDAERACTPVLAGTVAPGGACDFSGDARSRPRAPARGAVWPTRGARRGQRACTRAIARGRPSAR